MANSRWQIAKGPDVGEGINCLVIRHGILQKEMDGKKR